MKQQNQEEIWAYKYYPDFYKSDFVKAIAGNEKWTVSDKTKRPIDMRAFIDKQKIWGLAFDRNYNPLVDLETLIDAIPNASNNAYNLEAALDGFVVLDIEPSCPDFLKEELLKLPYLYGEVSMSGKGYHLVFNLPKEIWGKYPVIHNKVAMKEEHKYYEILLNHMVTFTRRILPDISDKKPIDEFEKIFETLASKEKETQIAKSEIKIDEIETDDIPAYGRTMSVLRGQKYAKSPDDFHNDMSKYEFGMAGFYYRALKKLTKNSYYKNVSYTDEQVAIIIYKLLEDKLEYREKHDTKRNNMPWLLYIATQLVAKNQNEKE